LVCGGTNGFDELSSVECLETEIDTWTELPSMSQGRLEPAAVVAARQLHVLGGSTGGVSLNLVEALDDKKGEWQKLPAMLQARRGPAAVSMLGQLWVCGGNSGLACLPSVESYNFESKEWQELPPMQTPRYGAIAAVLGQCVVMEKGEALTGGQLFICGGHNDEYELNSVECLVLNHEKGTAEWVAGPPMAQPRFMAAGAVHADPLGKPKRRPELPDSEERNGDGTAAAASGSLAPAAAAPALAAAATGSSSEAAAAARVAVAPSGPGVG